MVCEQDALSDPASARDPAYTGLVTTATRPEVHVQPDRPASKPRLTIGSEEASAAAGEAGRMTATAAVAAQRRRATFTSTPGLSGPAAPSS
jgi:hypothetical protein